MIVEKLRIPRCDVMRYGSTPCGSPATYSVTHKSDTRLVCNSHISDAIEAFEEADQAIEDTKA